MAEGKDKGWISLYRVVKDGWLWEDKPFARGQAWIDLLLQASHKERKILSKAEVVHIKKGSFLTSDQELANRWGWSRKKVRTFLEVLVNEHMITLERSPKGTSLTVVNWEVYQLQGTTKEQPKNNQGYNEGTTEEQPRNNEGYTNNNYNNNNNENNVENGENKNPPSLPSNPTEIESIILNQWGEIAYKTWFSCCDIETNEKDIKLKVPNKFTKDAIENKYMDLLKVLTGKEIIVEG